MKLQERANAGPGSPIRPGAAPGEPEVIVEKEVVEVEKKLGFLQRSGLTWHHVAAGSGVMPRIVEKEVVVQKVVQSGITEEEVQRIQWQASQSRAGGVFVAAVLAWLVSDCVDFKHEISDSDMKHSCR